MKLTIELDNAATISGLDKKAASEKALVKGCEDVAKIEEVTNANLALLRGQHAFNIEPDDYVAGVAASFSLMKEAFMSKGLTKSTAASKVSNTRNMSLVAYYVLSEHELETGKTELLAESIFLAIQGNHAKAFLKWIDADPIANIKTANKWNLTQAGALPAAALKKFLPAETPAKNDDKNPGKPGKPSEGEGEIEAIVAKHDPEAMFKAIAAILSGSSKLDNEAAEKLAERVRRLAVERINLAKAKTK